MENTKVSYVKKPFAKRSFPALALAVCALALSVTGLRAGVVSGGETSLGMAAVCFCGMLTAVVGFIYGVGAMLEKEKKYILARISLGINGILTVLWLILIIVGLRG